MCNHIYIFDIVKIFQIPVLFLPNVWLWNFFKSLTVFWFIKKQTEVRTHVPGSRTLMESCTACLSRLSRANIQWGLTCCCFNTFFTCQSEESVSSIRASRAENCGHWITLKTHRILKAEQHRLQAVHWYCSSQERGSELQQSPGQLLPVWGVDVVPQADNEFSDLVGGENWSFCRLLNNFKKRIIN